MEEKKPYLRRMQKSFEMIVSSELENKIRYLCSMFPNKEYSGTLFYTVEGTLEKGDIKIVAKDFYLQDIGNATFTAFKNDATLVTYMIDNNLLDCCTGIMHSHNVMDTFFSGTDIGTLEDEGKDTNHFVSLIVNNKGKYNAMLTAKITEKLVGSKEVVHHTFNNESYSTTENYTSENVVIEAYPLEITVEGRNYVDSLMTRINTINDIKAKTVVCYGKDTKNIPIYKPLEKDDESNLSYAYKISTPKEDKPKKKEPVQLQLFDNSDEEYDHWDKKEIENIVKQIVTGDIFAPMKKIDLEIWANNMEKVYNKRFGSKTIAEESASEAWINYFFEFLEWEFEDNSGVTNSSSDYWKSVWAFDIIDELEKLPKNKYIDQYISLFNELTV